mmetsp:Transcript_112326/g.356918  ORF Transcript_112326/g.356918 Transcript_112326/m.356918 type:complete len:880 (+) Transcript_112326:84-2723(+)
MALRGSAALSLGFLAAGAGVTTSLCPKDLDPYMGEASPFGWPVAPNEWQFSHPECWAQKYPLCAGSRQSPMNLDFTLTNAECKAKKAGAPGALATQAHYRALDGGQIVTVSKYMRSASVAGNLGSVMLKDGHGHDIEYEATSAHLTAGGVHTINGTAADAELMIVHKPKYEADALSGAVVVSVLFKKDSSSNSLFSQMGFRSDGNVDALVDRSEWKAPSIIDLRAAMQGALQGLAYSYSGSVPVPPCTENVHYIVLAAKQPVSEAQIKALETVLTKQLGGLRKRPAVRRDPDEICREILENSLDVVIPTSSCSALSDKTAACWATTCDKSPIDIEPSKADHAAGPVSAASLIAYTPTNHVTVAPSMYTLDAIGQFGHLLLNGRMFEAKKVSVKAVSQHTFNGTRHAGELIVEHVLFGDESDSHAAPAASQLRVMVSVPLKLGRENSLLRKLGLGVDSNKAAIRDGNSYEIHETVNLAEELKASTSGQWFWYSGGPTTPGACPALGVQWMVFQEPLEVSLAQLNNLVLPVSGMDSTVMPKPIDEKTVILGSLPKQAFMLGSCDQEDALHNDPACWAASTPACAGRAQSPIDIKSSAVSETGSESFLHKTSWKPVSGLRVVNDGRSLGFSSNQLGYTTVIGPSGFPKFYQVTGATLKMPSEHLINGKQYPAELQVIQKNQKTVLEYDDDDVIVSSFMFELGDENKLLKQMLGAKIPASGSYSTVSQPIDLQWALGPALDGPFFKYDGSYTTSSCSEVVDWAVFETPMALSAEQMQVFRAAFPSSGNNRPIQPLNDRSIVKNTMQEAAAVDHRYFLNREMARDKKETNPMLLLFPIVGTILLCSTVMFWTFQREDSSRKRESAGGLARDAKPSTIGRGYNNL